MKDLQYHLLLEAPDRASKTSRPQNADEAARLIGDYLGGEYASPGGMDATRRLVAMIGDEGDALSFTSPDGDVACVTLVPRDSGGEELPAFMRDAGA